MIVYNEFEWDVREASASLAAHGVTFKEASTIFAGEGVTTSEDPGSGHLRAVGLSSRGRMLVVLYKRGARTRILGATLHSNRAAPVVAPQPAAKAPPAPEPAASAPVTTEPVAGQPASRRRVVAPKPVTTEPVAAEPAAPESGSNGGAPDSGWTAETYEVYWNAYSGARQAARQQGKSHKEAQRLGRDAGQRAVAGHAEPSPKQVLAHAEQSPKQALAGVEPSPKQPASWRSAARAAKPAL